MMNRIALLILFAASAAFGASQETIFPIDAMHRGLQIVTMVTTLNAPPYNAPTVPQYEVAIQLASRLAFPSAPLVVNGLIPYVVSATPAPNDTLLIVKYQPRGTTPHYLVVPVEQVLAVVYSPIAITSTTGFSTNYLTGITPLLSINPVQRAADIQNVVGTLMTSPIYKTAKSTVAVYTTLSGPFYPAIQNGLITQVQSVRLVSANDTLMLITYLSNQNVTGTIIVAAEQVIEVVYYPNGS
jgi:hypothetical protein